MDTAFISIHFKNKKIHPVKFEINHGSGLFLEIIKDKIDFLSIDHYDCALPVQEFKNVKNLVKEIYTDFYDEEYTAFTNLTKFAIRYELKYQEKSEKFVVDTFPNLTVNERSKSDGIFQSAFSAAC